MTLKNKNQTSFTWLDSYNRKIIPTLCLAINHYDFVKVSSNPVTPNNILKNVETPVFSLFQVELEPDSAIVKLSETSYPDAFHFTVSLFPETV